MRQSYGPEGCSTSIELLTASAGDTLTASLARVSVAAGLRVDSHSQFQVFAQYSPHAANGTSATYCDIEVQYTEQPSDTADVSGGSGTVTWKTYTVESAIASAAAYYTTEFLIRSWRIFANDTVNKDRWPTFSVPLGAKRISALIVEQGAGGNFGTLVLKVGHQAI